MKRKQTILPIVLWILSTGMWCLALFLDLYHGDSPTDMVFLHAMCSVLSLAVVIFHIKDYIRQRK